MYQTLAQGEVLGRVVCDEGEGHDRDLSLEASSKHVSQKSKFSL